MGRDAMEWLRGRKGREDKKKKKKKVRKYILLKSKYLMLSFHEIISINMDAFVR